MTNMENIIRHLYFKVARGIDLFLFQSGKEGIWYHKKAGSKRTLLFLGIILLSRQEGILIKLLDLVGSKFPTAEIIGCNLPRVRSPVIQIRLSGFSKYMQEQKKNEIEDLLQNDVDLWNCALRLHLGKVFHLS